MKQRVLLLIFALISARGGCDEHMVVSVDKVLVKKTQRLLYLIKDGKIHRQYPISLGSDPVDPKQRMGDKRTPEGHYLIDYRSSKSQFYRALHINYPNATDRQRAKATGVNPGGQIFIHGSPNNLAVKASWRSPVDWTFGCIALSNEAIDEIWQLVKDGTPIEIVH